MPAMDMTDSLRSPSEPRCAETAPSQDSPHDAAPTPLLSSGRRRFLFETGLLTTGLAAAPYLGAQQQQVTAAPPRSTSITRMRLNVNSRDYDLTLDPRVTLLDALREKLSLTGTKKGCDRGQCGACTVLVNGRRVNSCLTLALSCDGYRVVTVEGLARGEALHPVQAAFVARDAFQCGYCTPGQICSAVALLEELKADTVSAATSDVRKRGAVAPKRVGDDEIRERMSGNICRCGAYVNIVAAIRDVAERST